MRVRATPTPTARVVLVGLGAFRLVTALWATVVTVVDARSGVMARPLMAVVVLGLLLPWSGWVTATAARAPTRLAAPAVVGADVALGMAVVATEWWAYDVPHPQSFGATWQLAPVMATAVSYGPWGGFVAGATIGGANVVAAAATEGLAGNGLALGGTFLFLGLAGATVGWVIERLRTAEDAVAAARARDEVAATLHDGVLQTLAVVQRRSDDPDLVRLAAAQDTDLRLWLTGRRSGPDASDVRSRLAEVVSSVAGREGMRAELVVLDPPPLRPSELDALAGAVGEALTNAARHAAARHVTVFCDRDEGAEGAADGRGGRRRRSTALVCTVVDDGVGFEPAEVTEGMGTRHSIVERLGHVGGTATVRSAPGRGTEWEMRL